VEPIALALAGLGCVPTEIMALAGKGDNRLTGCTMLTELGGGRARSDVACARLPFFSKTIHIELATSSLRNNNAGDLRTAEGGNSSTDTETDNDDTATVCTRVCTRVCTSGAATGDGSRLRELADAIRGLTDAERNTLRELLADSS
jgi:hypothetical protein